jgi:hypothetical protein
MKRNEIIVMGAAGLISGGLAIGLPLLNPYEAGPQVDDSLPAVVSKLKPGRTGSDYYINGVHYDGSTYLPLVEVVQCPEQNPQLTECVTDSFEVPEPTAATIKIGSFVVPNVLSIP